MPAWLIENLDVAGALLAALYMVCSGAAAYGRSRTRWPFVVTAFMCVTTAVVLVGAAALLRSLNEVWPSAGVRWLGIGAGTAGVAWAMLLFERAIRAGWWPFVPLAAGLGCLVAALHGPLPGALEPVVSGAVDGASFTWLHAAAAGVGLIRGVVLVVAVYCWWPHTDGRRRAWATAGEGKVLGSWPGWFLPRALVVCAALVVLSAELTPPSFGFGLVALLGVAAGVTGWTYVRSKDVAGVALAVMATGVTLALSVVADALPLAGAIRAGVVYMVLIAARLMWHGIRAVQLAALRDHKAVAVEQRLWLIVLRDVALFLFVALAARDLGVLLGL